MQILIPVFSLCLIFMAGCSTSETIDPFANNTIEGSFKDIQGTVQYIDLEGGFWAIITESNEKYNPMNLPDRFPKEDLKVAVKAKLRYDVGSVHIFGNIMKIQSIETL